MGGLGDLGRPSRPNPVRDPIVNRSDPAPDPLSSILIPSFRRPGASTISCPASACDRDRRRRGFAPGACPLPPRFRHRLFNERTGKAPDPPRAGMSPDFAGMNDPSNDPTSDPDRLGELSHESTGRLHRGERPTLAESAPIGTPSWPTRSATCSPPWWRWSGSARGSGRRPARSRPAKTAMRRSRGSWANTASCARSAAAAWASSTRRCRRSLGRHVALKVLPVGRATGPDPARAIPPRGAGGGPAAPHQHRPGLRRRRARGRPLLRHAVHPGPGPRRRPARGQAARGEARAAGRPRATPATTDSPRPASPRGC